MDSELYKQFLAAGNDDGNAQPPAANTRPPPTQSTPPALNVPAQVPHANRSARTTSRAVQNQGASQGTGQDHNDVDYPGLTLRYAALGTRAVAAGVALPLVVACVYNFEQHINAHRFIRGSPVTIAQLEGAIATLQEEVEYFEGQRAEMPESLGGGYGRSGFGGGYAFAMGPPGYGMWWN